MTARQDAERRSTLGAFAGFGAVWGCHAAAMPAIKDAACASDAVLGAALTSIGLAGLALAGAGVSVAAPTRYGLLGGTVPAPLRGRAVAAVTTVAYVGLLGGPGLVGQVAGLTDLRVGIGVLVVAAVTVALGAPLLRCWVTEASRLEPSGEKPRAGRAEVPGLRPPRSAG